MKKQFVTNLALLILLNLLVKPYYIFGIVRKVQVVAGAEDFGLYIPLFNLSILFHIVLDFGINNFNNRTIAQNNSLLSKYLSNLFAIKIILGLIYFVLCMFWGLTIGYSSFQLKLLMILLLNQFLAVFLTYFNTNISALHMFKTYTLMSILDRILLIILCTLLLRGYIFSTPFRIEWFAYAQTISYTLAATVSFFIVYSKTQYFKPNLNLKYILVIGKQTLPYALLLLLMAIYYRVDMIMVERMLVNGKEQAGIYAQSTTILDGVNNFALLFASLLLPIFAKMIKNKESVESLVHLSFLLLVVPALIFCVAAIRFNKELIGIMYAEHLEASAKIFSLLIVNFVLMSLNYIIGTLLTANGSMKALNIIAGIAVVMNVGLNMLLIPRYLAMGAAIASVITQIFSNLAQLVVTQKIFAIRINIRLMLQVIAVIVISWLAGKFSSLIDIPWFYKFVLVMIIGLISAFVLRLLRLQGFFMLLKKSGE